MGYASRVSYRCKGIKLMYTLYYGDCLLELNKVKDNSIDLIFLDLPYGTTQNKWDIVIPFKPLWEQLRRVVTPTGNIIFTATQPFTSHVVLSNQDWYRYDWIWKKTIGSGQMNVKRQPMRLHETILVFYRQFGIYNEQKTKGKPYKITRNAVYANQTYGSQKEHTKENDGFRHAQSVVEISNPRIKGGHPTEKPLALLEYILNTYSDIGMTVLDPTMGRGTTGVAAKRLGRNFIGIEKDLFWFSKAEERITTNDI